MNRRGFFKGVASMVGIALTAPIVKLLPKAKGVSIRVIRAYDPFTQLMPGQIDVLYGFSPLQHELNCHVASGEVGRVAGVQWDEETNVGSSL